MHAENGPVVAAPAFFKKKKFMHTKGLNREFALPKTIRILIFFFLFGKPRRQLAPVGGDDCGVEDAGGKTNRRHSILTCA